MALDVGALWRTTGETPINYSQRRLFAKARDFLSQVYNLIKTFFFCVYTHFFEECFFRSKFFESPDLFSVPRCFYWPRKGSVVRKNLLETRRLISRMVFSPKFSLYFFKRYC